MPKPSLSAPHLENLLARNTARYTELLENLPVGVLELDSGGSILRTNGPGATLLGVEPPPDLEGVSLLDLALPEAHPSLSACLADAREKGVGVLEFRGGRFDDPRLFHLKLFTSSADPDSGRMLAVIQDVTEQRRIGDALLQSEARLRQVVDLVPHFIFAKDIEGRFILVNRAVAEAYGTTVDELLGKTDADFNPNEEEVRHFREDDMRVIQSRHPKFIAEETITDSNGNLRYLQTIKIPYRLSGTKDQAILGVAVDITERKRSEDERLNLEGKLQTAQRLESLGVLAGGIAHDFNNLLVGIIGNAKMALAEAPEHSAERQHIEDLIVAATRAAELSSEMLAYSGRGKFVVDVLDLSRVVREMTQLLGTYVSDKAEITHDLPPDLPPVEADPTQIRQIIMNLITNSADAVEPGRGKIHLSTGVQHCGQECFDRMAYHGDLTEGRHVYVEVTDNGIGMDSKTQKRLFEPFYTTKFAGRGLGLSSVLGIIRSHRGGIEVESHPGHGSRFRVLFPASNRPPQRRPLPAAEGTSGGTGTVLVVDDEPTVLRLTQKVLESAGYTVLAARSGQDGTDIYRENRDGIAAVLLDMTMPGMSGFQVLKKLRSLNPDVRVLLSSGFSEEEAIGTLSGEQPTAFLHKPYDPKDLLAKMAETIGAPPPVAD